LSFYLIAPAIQLEQAGVPAFTVFIQGLISFFSPCVLPLLPVYMSYLAGGMQTRNEDGSVIYPRKKVFVNTLFFVFGVSFAIFLLGFAFTSVGQFFASPENKVWFFRIGGMIVIFFGLFQLGVFGQGGRLNEEKRLPISFDKLGMNPLVALLLGFTFSFAWTPCLGATLGSVLMMAGVAETRALSFLLIGVYTLGFVIPFLLVGLFTTSLLGLFKKHRNVVRYTTIAGGILMIVLGVLMFTGKLFELGGILASL
jgi:cytochrome c-type biogenesis protein